MYVSVVIHGCAFLFFIYGCGRAIPKTQYMIGLVSSIEPEPFDQQIFI